jgi:hypothetical protein
MRILMLTQFYQPIVGGEEQIVKDLSVELVRRGHEVAVVTLWQEGFQDFEPNAGTHLPGPIPKRCGRCTESLIR